MNTDHTVRSRITSTVYYKSLPIFFLSDFAQLAHASIDVSSIDVMSFFLEGGLYVKRKAGEGLFVENVEWKMTKVLAVKLGKR